MTWSKPSVREYCVGMEVTSYESADIGPIDPLTEIDSVTKVDPSE
jgi:coenzyme PQQ precursor peptide PqqA